MQRQPNTLYILSLSYGKDSLACLEAIKQLGYPLDGIVHAEIWATDTIPAELPPMIEFKKHADKIIKEKYGIDVLHVCATSSLPSEHGVIVDLKSEHFPKLTYEKIFYTVPKRRRGGQDIIGFPRPINQCNGDLKLSPLRVSNLRKQRELVYSAQNQGFSDCAQMQGADISIVNYLGIAADEPKRIARHSKRGDVILPLVDIGWDEAYCRKWCEENDLLSPIYTTSTRGGCWFCHNQSVAQLRLLRRDYPDLWNLLLKWDKDSPTTFKADGHTVHDYDKRFQAEDDGLIKAGDTKFRWAQILKKEETEDPNGR